MRRRVGILAFTVAALLAPLTSAAADPPARPEPPKEPGSVNLLWPVCGTVLGAWICVPP
jgi:hypothetical protein